MIPEKSRTAIEDAALALGGAQPITDLLWMIYGLGCADGSAAQAKYALKALARALPATATVH